MASERGSDPGLARAFSAAIPIASATDVVTARQRGRELAAKLGFSGGDQTVVATAISELARNILEYARTGQIELGVANRGSRIGLVVVAPGEGTCVTVRKWTT